MRTSLNILKIDQKISVALIDGGSFVMPYNFEFIRSLQSGGIDVNFFGSETAFNTEYLDAVRNLDGVTVRTQNISSSTGRKPISRLYWYVLLLLTVLFQARRFDLIAIEFTPAGYLESVFGWLVRRKLVFVLHNAVPHDSRIARHGPYAAIMRVAREIWCVSSYTAQLARELYPESAEKMRVVPHGAMGCGPGAPPCEYSPPEQFSDLLFWGTVKPYKGVDRLLSAQRRNIQNCAFNNFEIHGRWAPELSGLKAEFLEVGAEVNDAFLSTDEVMSLLQRDALFVLPYHAASQSGVLYTLMHHGRYFVTSDVGEIGDMLRKIGLESLLMEDFDLTSLRKKADWIIEHGDLISSKMRAAVFAASWEDAEKAARAFVARSA